MKVCRKVLAAALISLSGCASEVVRHPVELFAESQKPAMQYVVAQSALIRLDSGYERTLRAGTELLEIGTIKQGKVLKPVGTVFTVEGAHMHEAYLVVSDGRIVGFFLPVEGAFSPLSQFVTLSINKRSP